jgi:methylase of polypeptide subunit release factors
MVATARPISTLKGLNKINFIDIDESPFWNEADTPEIRMHKIHVYPAKFPSLIAKKAFEYAEAKHLRLETVADIFCGCGTVAVEAKRKGINFWGCDINPVAVLISEVKSRPYDVNTVNELLTNILSSFETARVNIEYPAANQRIKYWFLEDQYNDLNKLKASIIENTEADEYRKLFLCIFSSILKGASKWLTKSIKPQIDPEKQPQNVMAFFKRQIDVAIKAIQEAAYTSNGNIAIEHNDILKVHRQEDADMIVTSPPYVTSYEYADLHQLSALWLGYAEDYTELRNDSIGSSYGIDTKEKPNDLTPTAQKIVEHFRWEIAQTRSIARYYSDMQKFSDKAFEILKHGGLVVFVIGDTEMRGHHIENAKCLCECMIQSGFGIKEIHKRAVQNKLLPPHRDEIGKFSSDKSQRSIYSQEYIIIGRKA